MKNLPARTSIRSNRILNGGSSNARIYAAAPLRIRLIWWSFRLSTGAGIKSGLLQYLVLTSTKTMVMPSLATISSSPAFPIRQFLVRMEKPSDFRSAAAAFSPRLPSFLLQLLRRRKSMFTCLFRQKDPMSYHRSGTWQECGSLLRNDALSAQ